MAPAGYGAGGRRRWRTQKRETVHYGRSMALRYVVHCTTKALTLWNRLFSSIRFRSNVETSIGETSGGESVYGLRSLVVSLSVRVRRVESGDVTHTDLHLLKTQQGHLFVYI